MINYFKNIAACCYLVFNSLNIFSQPVINKVEYYIDTDPGYDNATPVTIIAKTDLANLTANINTSSLTTGAHLFGIRAKDANGAWSFDNKWLFVKDASSTGTPEITIAEYYIDTDPGYGNATPFNIIAKTNLTDLTVGLNTSSVSTGVHLCGIRVKDANGAWSLDNKWLFVKDALTVTIPNIVRVEYYVDADPGYGNASPANITSSSTNLVDIMQNVEVGSLADGVHFIGIRALDANGAWSLDNKLQFIISGGPLPILLSNFNGRYINNANELTVQIQQASNVKEVQLEKSPDGNSFKYLGTIISGTVTAGTYIYYDRSPSTGNIFYRLRIVDIDGKVSYSYVILLNHTSPFKVQMYPNPVQDNLTAHFENPGVGIYTIHITDILGKSILIHKVNISQNNQTGDVNISLSRYAAGTYFVAVTNSLNNIVSTQKIIKK